MQSIMLDSLPYSVSADSLIKRISKGQKGKISSRLKKQTKKALEVLDEYTQPRALYKVVECETKNCFDDDMFCDSKKVSQVFRGCEKAAVFLVTMGHKVDELIKKYLVKRPAYGYILDTAASMAAESAVESLEAVIEDKLPDDSGLTKRYSPGYCDWPLEGQKSLFDIIPYEKLDVTLGKNGYMVPRKSVSGIIGICPANSADASGNACRYCAKKNCPYRRL